MTPPTAGRVGLPRVGPPVAALLLSACIIPDTGIDVQRDFNNPGPVRLVQPIPMSERADLACCAASPILETCPVPPGDTIPFGLIDIEQQQLCVCSDRDGNALGSFEIFAEDPDFDEETGRPTDTLFAAFLLDAPRTLFNGTGGIDESVTDYVAYENYLPPTTAARIYTLAPGNYLDAIERPDPILRSWTIGQETGVDLCNDNEGTSLQPGLHELRIIATDRPWYVPVDLDEKGKIQGDVMGGILRSDEDALFGVPDLPAGASYATASYVFSCGDGTGAGDGGACNCVTEGP